MEQKLASSLRSTLQVPSPNWHACSKGSSLPLPYLFVLWFSRLFFFSLANMKLRKSHQRNAEQMGRM